VEPGAETVAEPGGAGRDCARGSVTAPVWPGLPDYPRGAEFLPSRRGVSFAPWSALRAS